MKKIICFIPAFIFLMFLPINCYALSIIQYEVNDEDVTVYCLSDSSDLTATVSGENAEIKKIETMSDEHNVKTVFLVDGSASMQSYKDKVYDFLNECISVKKANEIYSFAQFTSKKEPDYIISDTSDRYDLEKSLDSLRYDGKSSYIYDNLLNVVEQLESEKDTYKRIVLFTDGIENSATGITIDEVKDKLKEHTVQIYTVSFVNKDKTNYESLKQVAALARSSGGQDIQIAGDASVKDRVSDISSELDNLLILTLIPPSDKYDTKVYPVTISSGDERDSADMRMPYKEFETTTAETTVSTTTASATLPVTEVTEPVETEKGNNSVIVIAICAGVAVIIIAVLCIVLIKKSKKKEENVEPEPVSQEPEAAETVFLGDNSRSGDTEFLFSDIRCKTVILRDIKNPAYFFEKKINEGDQIIIGRDSTKANTVIDYDNSVSGKHCCIFIKSGELMVEDLGSKNKTYLNSELLLSPHHLLNGDEIRIGRVKLSVTIKE